MRIRITYGSGWYRDCVGEIFEVTGRHTRYDAYYVKRWNDSTNEWETHNGWVSDGNYEIVESEEVTVDTSQASEQVIEMLANLARRVNSLERQLADTQRNLETFAEQTEDNSEDIRELDERSQILNAINKYYAEGSR
jgi:DNA repair ATPase RecN